MGGHRVRVSRQSPHPTPDQFYSRSENTEDRTQGVEERSEEVRGFEYRSRLLLPQSRCVEELFPRTTTLENPDFIEMVGFIKFT